MNQKNKKQHQIVMVGISIILVTLAFFAGAKYQVAKTPTFDRSRLAGMVSRGQGMGQATGANMIRGEIGSIDPDTLTVKLVDGSSKIIFLSDTTAVSKSDQATINDLIVGSQVVVFGQTNSDDSVSAQNIQLNPADFRPGHLQ